MKKLVLCAAIIATVASCSKNEVENIQSINTIGFTSLNDNVTRANITGQANDQKADYKVYATTDSKAGSWFIDGGVLSTETPAGNTTYFWPNVSGEKSNFYAYAPADAATLTAETDGSGISIDYAVDGTSDFTVAAPILDQTYFKAADGTVTATNAGNVNFVFSHMLAKVEVKVALSDELKTAGYSLGASNTAKVIVNESTGTVEVMDAAPAITPATTKVAATYEAAASYYVLPQTAEGCTIQATDVTINDIQGNALHTAIALNDYEITSADAAAIANFEAGKSYVITLTINDLSTDEGGKPLFDDAINFSVEMVNWTEVTVGLTQK